MTHAARPYAALLVLAAAFAGLAALLLPNPASAATPAVAPAMHATVLHTGGTAVSATLDLIAATSPDSETLTPAQAQAADEAADRVCEGYVALVPARVIVGTVAAQSGLSPEQASAFVTAAHSARCPNF